MTSPAAPRAGAADPAPGTALDLADRRPPAGRRVHAFQTRRRIEFSDTDMGGIVHFSRFFVFMETAEHELLLSLGTDIHTTYQGREIGWPRLSAHCDYRSPARFGDELTIRVLVERKGRTSMSYRFLFDCGERRVAEGRVSSVCCFLRGPEGLETVAIPPFLADQLEEAPDGPA